MNIKNKIKKTVDLGRKNEKVLNSINELADDQEAKFSRVMFERKHSNFSSSHRSRSILLNKLSTQKKINDDFDNREYRLVTGGDDGHVFFWNIPYDFINEAKDH